MTATKTQVITGVNGMVITPPTLTREALDILGAPIPTDQIKYRKGDYGKDLAYTSTEFVQDRLSEVDLAWESRYRKEDDTIICTLTVLGVTREATAGIEERRTFKNRETGKETMESNHVVKTAAEAKAFKRAASYFLVARELWTDLPTDRPAYQSNGATQTQTQTKQTTAKQPGGDGLATPNMIKTLVQLGVPEGIAGQLTLGDLVDGKRNGEASQMIGSLIATRTKDRDAYDGNKGLHVRRALSKIANHLLDEYDAGGSVGSEYDDEDLD